ncbi:hypothetical protein D3C81_770380 [compost metagenome]
MKAPFCALSILMDTDNRCIDHDAFKVGLNGDLLQDAIPNTGDLPAMKPAIHGGPGAVILR